jgi:hypothetical protein
LNFERFGRAFLRPASSGRAPSDPDLPWGVSLIGIIGCRCGATGYFRFRNEKEAATAQTPPASKSNAPAPEPVTAAISMLIKTARPAF